MTPAKTSIQMRELPSKTMGSIVPPFASIIADCSARSACEGEGEGEGEDWDWGRGNTCGDLRELCGDQREVRRACIETSGGSEHEPQCNGFMYGGWPSGGEGRMQVDHQEQSNDWTFISSSRLRGATTVS